MSEDNEILSEEVGGRGCGGDVQTKGGVESTDTGESQTNAGGGNEPETQETGEHGNTCE